MGDKSRWLDRVVATKERKSVAESKKTNGSVTYAPKVRGGMPRRGESLEEVLKRLLDNSCHGKSSEGDE